MIYVKIICYNILNIFRLLYKNKNNFSLGKRIFEPVMYVDNDIGEWNLAWIASGIQVSDMVYLAVQYWLSKPLTLTVVTEMINFHRVIDTICNTDGRHFIN